MWWSTKDGSRIHLKDMRNEHLLNAQRYMQRRLRVLQKEIRACNSCTFQGEMAQIEQERDLDRMETEHSRATVTVVRLDAEIKSRGLTAKPV